MTFSKSTRPDGLRLLALISCLLLQIFTKAHGQWTSSGADIYNSNTGNVGIGTTTPHAKLEVNGNLLFLTSPNQIYMNNGTLVDNTKAGFRCNTGDVVFNSKNNGKLFLNRDVNSDVWIESSPDGINNIEIATFKASGNVGIGTTTPKAKLAVNGDILALKVTVSQTNLPDYVFNDDYRLLSLDSTRQYIRANHHLPGMPSADSVAKAGLNLGDNQAALLKKIEELTLYVLQLQQQVNELKVENGKMAAKIGERPGR
jgi:hypothetical protein